MTESPIIAVAPSPPGPGGWHAVLEEMRVHHWVKNGFVAAGLLFGGKFGDGRAWAACLTAVLSFCLLSSGVYLINDVCDRESDRNHPVKRNRPVASGRLSVGGAIAAAAVLFLGGLLAAGALTAALTLHGETAYGVSFLVLAGAYAVLNLAYSLWLKNKAILDVILVSMGFDPRAMAGASAVAVPISPWLVICTFSLCLFIALTKRRSEIGVAGAQQGQTIRPAIAGYTAPDLEHMIDVSAAIAILTYTLYCLAPRTTAEFKSAHMIWTVPLVVYGLFRYNRSTRSAVRDDPVRVLVRDRIMWLVVGLYILMTVAVRLWGPAALLRKILDF